MPDLHVYFPDPDSEAWRQDAACIGLGPDFPDLFFPAVGAPTTNRIEAMCIVCPVQDPCLAFAIDENIKIGWWGGLPPRARRRLRKYMRQGMTLEDAAHEIRRERLLETQPVWEMVG